MHAQNALSNVRFVFREHSRKFSGSNNISTPGVVRYVAGNNFRDPRGFLRNLMQVIGDISKEPDFSDIARFPSVIRRAALSNPLNPRAALRSNRSSKVWDVSTSQSFHAALAQNVEETETSLS